MPAGEMDGIYTIGTTNRFDMIGSDSLEDPHELIRAAQERPKKEKEPKVKGKKEVKPTKQADKKNVKIESPTENESSENRKNERPRSDRGRGNRGGRGRGRGGDRGGRGRGGGRGGFNSPNSPSNQDGFGFDNNNQPSGGFGKYQPSTEIGDGFGSGFGGDSEERRGGRSGFRGGRGGRGGRGRGRGGNREFDRRSGSDKSSVKAVDKRDGSGSYNWGTPQDEIKDASEEHSGGFGAPKETEDTPTDNTEQTQESEETPVEEVKDEGPQEMTFEEYKKMQKEERNKPEFNIRKVESEKTKGMKQLKKPSAEENENSNKFYFPKKVDDIRYKSSGREKERIPCNIRYGCGENRHLDTTRRGGRGGGRGRRGGGAGGRKDDSGNAKGAEIALSNDEEFPSLG